MARIPPATLQNAPEETKPILEGLKKKLGITPNLFATIGHSPEALTMLLSAMDTLGKGKLSAREIESVNLWASELNGCAYCVSAHSPLARGAGMSPEDALAVRLGRGSTAREQAILDGTGSMATGA